MNNLLKFIQRNSNFLLFLVLEVAAFLLFFLTQPYQQSRYFSASNEAIAGFNQQVHNLTDYISLGRVNQSLAEENARLLEEIQVLQSRVEPMRESDSTYTYSHLTWKFSPAKVVDIQTSTNHNYLVLNKGERDGVLEGEGVLSQQGVVGVVSKVNRDFSLVVPVVHPKMHLSSCIQKNGQQGFLYWTGGSSAYAYLSDIGRHVQVEVGDTIVTSGLTGRFPEGVMVGVIDKVKLGDGDANYSIRVRLSTDFGSVRYVQIIKNPLYNEYEQLREMVK